jgi:hypothetical protein
MKLEERLESVKDEIRNKTWDGIGYLVDLYNQVYEKYPKTTSYLSTAVGTIGGDAIAKRFVDGENVKLRDVAFTSSASMLQAYFYPKLIPLAEKIVDNPKVENVFKKIKINKAWGKAITLTALFFPVNMLYWNFLSLKNKSPINFETNLQGVKTISEASVPYIGVDYLVANKLDKRYALPVWSGAELGWNTFVALENYIARDLFKI